MKMLNHILLYSVTTVNRTVSGEVGFLFPENPSALIGEWKFVNDRVMTFDLEEGENLQTLIIVYGPNENAAALEKDNFFEILQREIDDAKGVPIIIRDLNGRVGRDSDHWPDTLGRYGEVTRNNNGERILDLCAANGLVVTMIRFPHRVAHIFTRESASRKERSIIDYFLMKKEDVRDVIDVREKRGFVIGGDHCLLKLDKTWRGEEN